MAFADISPQGALWRNLGLRFLLMQEDVPAAWQAVSQQSSAPKHEPPVVSPRPVRPARGVSGPAGGVPPAAAVPRVERARPVEKWQPLPPQSLPAAWQERLRQTKPGLVAWTYWNLGPDLCGLPEPEATERETSLRRQERRAILQRILAVLGHPQGTHTFWPCCLPAAGPDGGHCFQPHADAFWSGLARLGARGVVVMGSAAVKALELPSNLRPMQQTRHRGHLVWVLQDVEYLLEQQNDGPVLPSQPEQLQGDGRTMAFLQRALHLLVRR